MEINKEDTLEIGKTHNGYLLKNYWVEDTTKKAEKIFDDDLEIFEFDGDDSKEAFIKLVNKLAEYLGFSYNKFGEENLNVSFDKRGHKLE